MSKVELMLSEDEYRALLRLLYFADYCAFAGALRVYIPKDPESRQIYSEAVEKFYAAGDQLDLPKSLSLTSMADYLPFAEDELLEAKGLLERDLDYMAQANLAQAFAEQEVNRVGLNFDFEGGHLQKDGLIVDRMTRYLEEFKTNGFANLRIKFLHRLPPSE